MTCAFALMLAATALPQPGAYPDPAKVGFHHCALIYGKAVRDEANMRPYVAKWSDGHARQWMFDAFLFLTAMTSKGVRTEYGESRMGEWADLLDTWFSPGRDLAALDQAIASASADLGAPPKKRQVMLCIPYANPAVHDFGDVNGDGRSEDLATAAGRKAVFDWYVAEGKRRFDAANFKHIELWGYYWMREDMGPLDQAITRAAAAASHGVGERFFWIPWHNAPGWEIWPKLGFDVCIMQPNYAFIASHGGRIRRNRLASNADKCLSKGLGVEMEAGDLTSSAEDRRAFLHYLCDGAPSRCGYQAGTTAYYLDTDLVGATSSSSNPEVRAMYDALADYIAGKPVADPDPKCDWSVGGKPFAFKGSGLPAVVEGRFPSPQPVGEFEVFLDEPVGSKPWRGMVRVEGRRPGETNWSALGWALRSSGDATSGRRQVLVVPVGTTVEAARIRFEPSSSVGSARLSGIGIKPTAPAIRNDHLALQQPYTFPPAQVAKAKYGDDGTKLTDGVIPALGYPEGRSVGWLNEAVAIRFDLGSAMPVSEVRLFAQGGGAGACEWPVNCTTYLCTDASAPLGSSGLGAPPNGLTLVAPEPVKVIRRRNDTNLDGVIVFRPAKPALARYVTVSLEPNSWIMLTEMKILSNGRNVAPEATYTLTPPPTRDESEENVYLDDGKKLTDGQVADGFKGHMLVGWQGSEPRVTTIDLGRSRPIGSITAWSLRGGDAGIYAPESATFELSQDGVEWFGATKVAYAGPAEDGSTCSAAPFTAAMPAGASARWVRVTVVARKEWAMLSEVEVWPPAAK